MNIDVQASTPAFSSLSSILSAIVWFDSNSPWAYRSDNPDYIPAPFSLSQKSAVEQAIATLYSSATGRSLLESAAASGSLRFGFGTQAGLTIYADPSFGNVDYFIINPDRPLVALNNQGNFFDLSLPVIIGHELGHLVNRVGDLTLPVNEQNIAMNKSNFDYDGQNIATEWQITSELYYGNEYSELYEGELYYDSMFNVNSMYRASYKAGLYASDSRVAALGNLSDNPDLPYIWGQEVRLGDFDTDANGNSTNDDYIDVSQQSSSIIIRSLSGRDYIVCNQESYVFAGSGDDVIKADGGRIAIYGEEGDDKIIVRFSDPDNPYSELTVSGGYGDDMIVGFAITHYMGDDGNDKFLIGAASITYPGDSGPTHASADGGAGDDFFWITNSTFVSGGLGADVYYMDTATGVVATMFIRDLDTSDKVYWQGFQLTGGSKAIVDMEALGGFVYQAVGYVGTYGEVYEPQGSGYKISLPDGSVIIINDLQPGMAGIVFDSPITSSDRAEIYFDQYGEIDRIESSLPIREIAFDGVFGDYAFLPEASMYRDAQGPLQVPGDLLQYYVV